MSGRTLIYQPAGFGELGFEKITYRELFAKLCLLGWDQPGLGIEVILLRVLLAKSIKVSTEVGLSGQIEHSREMVDSLIRPHLC